MKPRGKGSPNSFLIKLNYHCFKIFFQGNRNAKTKETLLTLDIKKFNC